MRICSFLPAATEILFALGLGDSVVGVTHECDYPAEARAKPPVVRSRITHATTAAEIDRQVREFTARGESIYEVDAEALRRLQPDLAVTQDLCHVCAAAPGDLASALATLSHRPEVLTLNPRTTTDVWNDIRAVGKATGRAREAEALVKSLEARVAAVELAVRSAPVRPRVLCLEWLDPPFGGGHWVPEMVARAGGTDVLGKMGEPSFRIRWEQALASQADVAVVMPCGYDLEQSLREFRSSTLPPAWNGLPAVRQERVFVVDAASYFSRPGPRLATGIEILGSLFHPEQVRVTLPAGAVAPAGQASIAGRV